MSSSFVVPDNIIMIIPNEGISPDMIDGLITNGRNNKKRDWFSERFYFCLPVVIGNQYGYTIHAQRDFTVTWNGGDDVSDLDISEIPFPVNKRSQAYISNFGSGILTIQNFWHMRTPPGVNTMVISPPNYIKDNVTFMTAVVETDNLRRGFTFNLKLNNPGSITFKAGEVIGAFINIPRYFVDSFSLVHANNIISDDQIKEEHDSIKEFDRQRTGEDMGKTLQSGRKYFKGEDAWGNPFPDHQQRI